MPKKATRKTKEKGAFRTVINGLGEFPLEVLGLTPESIERSNGRIHIPVELLPYLKICKMPKHYRDKNAAKLQAYRLRLRHKESQRTLNRTPRKSDEICAEAREK